MDRPRALGLAFLGVWGFGLAWNGGVTVEATAILTGALALLNVAAARLLPDPIRLSRVGVWFFAGVGALFLVQLLPTAPLLFPVTHGWRLTHGIAGAAWWPGTADTYRTLLALTTFCLYALSALLVIRLRQAGLGASTMLRAAVCVLAAEAVYGLVQQFAGLKDVPFYGPREYPDSASGTLVGRNNFGGLMAVGFVLAVALAWGRFSWPIRIPSDAGKPRWLRKIEGGAIWAMAAMLFAVAIVLSRSRGSALAAIGGAVALLFLFRGRASVAGAVTLGILAAGAVFVTGLQPLLDRFGVLDPADLDTDSRWGIFTSTFAAALHQPVLGFGFGTHPVAYHPYQPPSIPGQVHHAHNEYLNVFFEAGASGVLLFVAALAFWSVRTWKAQGALPGPDRLHITSALAGIAVTAIHSFVDFDLRIPSNGILFACLIGIGAAICRSGVGRPRLALGVCGMSGLAALLLFSGIDPVMLGERARSSGNEQQMERLSLRALTISPYEYRAAWALARASQRRGDVEATDRRFAVAAELWPAHPELQRVAGLWFWEAGPSGLDRASACFRRLFEQSPQDIPSALDDIWRSGRRSLEDIERLIPEQPAATASYACWLAHLGDWPQAVRIFEKGVPSRAVHAALYDSFAAALEASGQWGLEAMILDRRLQLKSDASTYGAAARAWLRLKVLDRALHAATTAARIDPSNPVWTALRGDVLHAEGNGLAAAEAYTEAIAKAPMELAYREHRAWIFLELKMFDPAADDFSAVLRSRPLQRSVVLGLAQCRMNQNQAATARLLLGEYLANFPEDSEAKQLLNSLPKD